MAATTFGEEHSRALKCQTWVLKVSIHCQGCKRKVKKVLQGIDGVYTAAVDSQEQRVTVTGNIEVETLIKKLIKTGKHAEIWPEKLPSKEKESAKAKAMHKQKDPKKGHNFCEKEREKTVQLDEDGMSEKTKDIMKSPENPIEGIELPAVKKSSVENEGGGGGVAKSEGKKKKRRGQKGDNGNNDSHSGSSSSDAAAGTGNQTQALGMDEVVGPSNLSPPCQQSVQFPQGFIIPPVYASSYSMAYPRESPGPLYYVPVPVYAHPSIYNQVNPLDSLYYFSDDNINGCSIM